MLLRLRRAVVDQGRENSARPKKVGPGAGRGAREGVIGESEDWNEGNGDEMCQQRRVCMYVRMLKGSIIKSEYLYHRLVQVLYAAFQMDDREPF